MKKIIWLLCGIIVNYAFLSSCSKTIKERTADLPALSPAEPDADAGTWKNHFAKRT